MTNSGCGCANRGRKLNVRTRNANDQAESAAIRERAIEGVARKRRGAAVTRFGRRAESGLYIRRQRSHQPGIEQLPWIDDTQSAAESRCGSGEEIWSWGRRGAHDCRNDAIAHASGRADCEIQERAG